MLKKSLIAAISLAALFACGYSGPLYLPKNAANQTGATTKNQFAPNSLAQTESANESTTSKMPPKSLLPATIIVESANLESANAIESNPKTSATTKN
ncbi:MAG: lipoprotein [Burkholderiales bacterium]|nr:lipoprotein [Burkholderiales bacterium]